MSAAAILELLNGIISIAPELLSLYQKATSGTTVTDADIQAIFDKYNVDRAQLQADITAGVRP